MKKLIPAILPALFLLAPMQGRADDAVKTKVIDTFQTLDPKSTQISEIKVRTVPAPEVPHKRALEITADYAKSGAYYYIRKVLPAGAIDLKKYSGVRFWLKSSTETTLHLCLQGKADGDGRPFDYRVVKVTGGKEWKSCYYDFSNFRFYGFRIMKNGQPVVFPSVDLTPSDLDRVLYITFAMHEAERGNSVISNVQVAGLELVAK